MCGIAGGIYWQGQPTVDDIQQATTRLHHRGPDEQGVFIRDQVALGHARLSIIDLAGGTQPLHSPDDQLHLVANGEVYNYIELKQQSTLPPGLTQSDSEAILQTYREDGHTGIKRLNGMFAFALYDQVEKTLTLARDRLGIKPLYYAPTARGLFFASELKALLPLIGEQPEIDPSALNQFLMQQFSTGRDTVFKQIKRLQPGEYLVAKDGSYDVNSYWSMQEVEQRECTLEQAFEEFEPLFAQVMTEHMRADVPFGLFLSGGIDSSILLAELAKLHDNKLRTYSIGFSDTKEADELDAATSLAEQFNTDHHAIRVGRDDLFGRIVKMTWAADDLMRDYASLPTLYLAEQAAKDVKVVFSGEGGDEAFAGYRRYKPGIERWLKMNVLGSGIAPGNQWHAGSHKALYGSRLQHQDRKAPYMVLWNETPKHWSSMKRRQYVDLKAALVDNLFVKTDRMLMAHGLEGRVPLSDHRIVEFGMSLPDSLKYNNNRGKWVLRQWAEKYLPKDHLNKPKRGFYVPVKEWFAGDFVDQLEHKLLTNHAVGEWFRPAGIKDIFARQRAGKNYTREMWSLMQFAIWHQLFIDGEGAVPSTQENPLDWI
ncbi:asparagine synthase (glutamine-hydrolyzing) [Echinimonas agarilytica]|uniref:asparagine synthase (glutamine-hydrolyzing) n=1 Tax=Echinimonas agarilytica TaxID=1215918 RepID=A0AA41W4K3_9GAMM|nr:asparagine synthase (glutamine-hydrolyzing) [Echinimonas agarilytica]MCM2678651.1 asparagine synthase (glutamine-hydrolyzing) [Echinimonas agarilytica]